MMNDVSNKLYLGSSIWFLALFVFIIIIVVSLYLEKNNTSMDDLLNELYEVKINVEPNIWSGLLFVFLFIIIVIILSLYLEIKLISMNWENERCNYIFTAGIINPDKNKNPIQYAKDNLHYCIKKHIYTKSPIIPYMKKLYNELDYLVKYLQQQINTYNYFFYKNSNEDLSGNYHEVKNKINYLKRKERNIKEIQTKMNDVLNLQNDKIKDGINKIYTYNKQGELVDKYRDKNYNDHLLKNYD